MASNSVIGALRVNLGLDSAQFTRGIKQSQSELQRFAARAKGSALAAVGAFAAVAGGLAVLTASTARTAKEIERFSQVANSTPEQFQRWSAASKSVGIEQEKLSDILKDVNDRVGDFIQTGGGPMADFFENIAPKVGVTADQFKRLSGPDALQLYVDTLQKAGASQQEMTFYLEAMASDTTALLPLLRNGGEELRRMGDNAQSLGVIMGGSAVAALAAFDVSLANVGMAISGVKNRISAELAPAFTALSDAFVNAMREGGSLRIMIDALIDNISLIASTAAAFTGFLVARWVGAMALSAASTLTLKGAMVALRTAIARTGFGVLIVGAGVMIDRFGKLVTAAGGFGNALGLLKAVAYAAMKDMGLYLQGFYNISVSVAAGFTAVFMDAFTDTIANAYAFVNKFITGPLNGLEDWLGLDRQGAIGAGNLEGLRNTANGLRNSAVAAANAATANFDSATKTATAISALRDAMTTTEEATTAASDAAGNLSTNLDGIGGGGGAGGGGGSAGAAAAGVDTVTDAVETMGDKMESVRESIKSAFKGLVSGAMSFKEALGTVLKSLADVFASKAADNFFGGGGKPSAFGTIGKAFAGMFDSGGFIPAGKFGIAGEYGPEFVRGPANVTSRVDTARMMGGGAVQVIGGDLTLTDSGSIMARVRVVAAQSGQQAVSTVQGKMRASKSWANG